MITQSTTFDKRSKSPKEYKVVFPQPKKPEFYQIGSNHAISSQARDALIQQKLHQNYDNAQITAFKLYASPELK